MKTKRCARKSNCTIRQRLSNRLFDQWPNKFRQINLIWFIIWFYKSSMLYCNLLDHNTEFCIFGKGTGKKCRSYVESFSALLNWLYILFKVYMKWKKKASKKLSHFNELFKLLSLSFTALSKSRSFLRLFVNICLVNNTLSVSHCMMTYCKYRKQSKLKRCLWS